MQQLSQGGNAPLQGTAVEVVMGWSPTQVGAGEPDVTAFMLTASGKVRGDTDMVFYNQPDSPCGGLKLSSRPGESTFRLALDRLPPAIERIAFTATLSDGTTFGAATSVRIEARGQVAYALETAGMTEAAVILAELYLRNGTWRLRAVGQGFNGGLAPLATYFGIEVADDAAPAAAPTPTASATKVRLDKQVSLLKDSAPKLVSLAKKAQVSLEKRGLADHTAAVALCMDVSGSMMGMFRDGTVKEVLERVLGLGINFDDNGAIDLFYFANRAGHLGELGAAELNDASDRLLESPAFGGGTSYAPVIELMLKHYGMAGPRKATPHAMPVYVLFVTDGSNDDKRNTEKVMKAAAEHPIFFQFVGIGGARFDFLEKLDDLKGRLIDNADFFAVRNPKTAPEGELYDQMMNEYPKWLTEARRVGILR